jgi:uncharacterized membrane protein
MNRDMAQIWATLLQADLVQGPAPATDKLESPWYVKVLLAFSGWLAALFLLGFIGVGFKFIIQNSVAAFIAGAAMIAGAAALLRAPKNEFYEHLSLAVSLAGQALIAVSILDAGKQHWSIIWILLGSLQTLLAIVMPNFVHRVFSAFVAAMAFSSALTIAGTPYIFSSVVMLLTAWLWLNEFRYPRHMRKMQATGYGLVLALILLEGTTLFSASASRWQLSHQPAASWTQPWMAELLAAAVTLYVVWQLLQRCGQLMSGRLAMLTLSATLVLCGVSMEAHGITAGIVIMVLGFAGSNRLLSGLGVLSLLFYISSYYYRLDATLLTKAQTLLIVGVVLLTARWLLLHLTPSGAKGANRV